MTTANLHYQRARPSPLWSRLCPETRIGRGLARIPQILWGKAHCGAAPGCPRLARRVVAPHGRGGWWRERPPLFRRWCATGQGEVVHAKIHHLPSPRGGRSLHRDPWREGNRADEEAEAAVSTTGRVLRARDANSGSNNPNAVRVDAGTVTQHLSGDDLFTPSMHSGTPGFQLMSCAV